jgi:hypothetical protein
MLSEKEKLLKSKAKEKEMKAKEKEKKMKAKEKEKKMKAKEKEKKMKAKEKEMKAKEKAKSESVGGNNMFSLVFPFKKDTLIQKILNKMNTIPSTFQFILDRTKGTLMYTHFTSVSINEDITLSDINTIVKIKNYLRLYDYFNTISLFMNTESSLLDRNIIREKLKTLDDYELTIVYNNIIKNGSLYSDMISKILKQNIQYFAPRYYEQNGSPHSE